MDPDPEEASRKKKTLLLLAGGAVSLILPLLGVLYLRWKETQNPPRQTDAAVFQQREAGERRITLPLAPAPPAAVALSAPPQVPSAPPPTMSPLPGGAPTEAPAGGSLGFIKPSGDYYSEKKPEPEPKKEEAKPAPPPEEPKPAKAAKAKPGKKPFVMPKLNTSKGFTRFKRDQPAAEDAAGGSDADVSEMLKNLPPGAEKNPEIQKLLQGK